MEKWAKMLNAQKEGIKKATPQSVMPNASYRPESASADAGFALFEKTVRNSNSYDYLIITFFCHISFQHTSLCVVMYIFIIGIVRCL